MVFDGHSDILSDVRIKRAAGKTQVLKNYHLERLKKGGISGGCFAIWVNTLSGVNPEKEMDIILQAAMEELSEAEEFVLVHNKEEYECAVAKGKIAVLLGIEGLCGIGKKVERIYELHEMGCRHAMLTWNEENELATGVRGDLRRGVTELGKKAIRLLQQQKMLLDVSHLNERSFWDVMKLTEAPVLASHSNAKALASASRNLTDAQLFALRDVKGLVGLNAYPQFVSDHPEKQNIDGFVKQAVYIAEKIGVEHLGFGFDFLEFLEGEGQPLLGLEDCSEVPTLFRKMKEAGFTDEEVQKIAVLNWLEQMEKGIK